MTDPKIVASARDAGRRPLGQVREATGTWAVLGWIGLVFLVVGGTDFVLTWLPFDFGNPEWEFGTVTASFNGLPILLLGLGFLVVAAEQVERPWWGTLAMVAAATLLLWVVVGAVLWATTVSLAFATVPDELALGVQRSVVKTSLQSIVYALAFGYLAVRGRAVARGNAAVWDGTA